MSVLDLSMVPHAWPRGTVVLLVFPHDAAPICLTLEAGEADNAMGTFDSLRAEMRPEVMVMFEADGMPDGRHLPLAHFPGRSACS